MECHRGDGGCRRGTRGIEVAGEHGMPPYLIRWQDGHQSLFFPSSDTVIERPSRPRAG